AANAFDIIVIAPVNDFDAAAAIAIAITIAIRAVIAVAVVVGVSVRAVTGGFRGLRIGIRIVRSTLTIGSFFWRVRFDGIAVIGIARLEFLRRLLLDQRFTIRDGELVIVGMNFVEGEKAVAITAIFHKGRLQRGFDPGHLCEIDIAFKLFFRNRLVIKFFKTGTFYYYDACLFLVRRVDQHTRSHTSAPGLQALVMSREGMSQFLRKSSAPPASLSTKV